MYTGQCTGLLEKRAQDLLVMADKYQMESLVRVCEQNLCNTLTPDNAVALLVLAETHSAQTLRDTCVAFVTENVDKIACDELEKLAKVRPELLRDLFLHAARRSRKRKFETVDLEDEI
eukprot:TRINITY_DN13296_c0_g1_i2.p4 TRINITY_DN13296_c0_g1~~TRINITY_DN13296_c0_g1_i2.p4  ORF type:complete len:118 (-),score=27.36 TRINITY_DN13296_c0_g1_i2:39-392(-)